jgi:hypothetical protein
VLKQGRSGAEVGLVAAIILQTNLMIFMEVAPSLDNVSIDDFGKVGRASQIRHAWSFVRRAAVAKYKKANQSTVSTNERNR